MRERGAAGRRWRLVALVLLALAVLGALWMRRPGARAPEPAPTDVAAAPEVVPAPPAAAPAEAEPLPEPIRRWLAATPYPPTSGLLSEAHEDLLRPNRRHERPRPIPDTVGHDPSAVVTTLLTADHYYYVGDETPRATLKAWRGGRPFELELLDASLVAEGRAGREGAPLPADFRWEGDRHVADLRLGRLAEHHGPVVLAVRYAFAPEQVHEEELRFFVTPVGRVPARLTGEVSDALRGGSLVLDVGVEVLEEGFYRFDANLRDAAGEPTAFALWKGELRRSDRSFPLEVYGKVLRDAGGSGPWTVSEVRGYRFLDGRYPDRERLPDTDLRYQTRAWPLDALTDEVHTSPHELHMVELMREDLARGLSLQLPGLPAAGEAPGPRPPDDDVFVGGAPPEPDAPATPPPRGR